jgi:hypothetical protein
MTHVYAPHDASTLTGTIRWATDRQVSYIESLLTKHGLYDGEFDRLWKILEMHRLWMQTKDTEDRDGTPMNFDIASRTIDWVKGQISKHGWTPVASTQPVPQATAPVAAPQASKPAVTTPGVYFKDAVIYVVQPSRKNPGRLYAKRIVESPERLNDAGNVVEFEFVYDAGAVWKLTDDDKMSLEDAHYFMLRYGRCLKCKRSLKAAKTLKTAEETGVMVGPVCRKYFT